MDNTQQSNSHKKIENVFSIAPWYVCFLYSIFKSLKNYIFCGKKIKSNSKKLQKKVGFYQYIREQVFDKNDNIIPIKKITTTKGNLYFVSKLSLIKEILGHYRVVNGDIFTEGRQLYVIAEAMGKYRLSQDKKDTKQKRSILASMLSKPIRYARDMESQMAEFVRLIKTNINSVIPINTHIQRLTLALYLRPVFQYSGTLEEIPQILEQQIALLADRLVYKKNETFSEDFLFLQKKLVDILLSDPNFQKSTDYKDKVNNYINTRHADVQQSAFYGGVNTAVLAGYLAPYPTFMAVLELLGNNPSYFNRIRDELNKNMDSEGFSLNYLKAEDTLLNAVICEVLRLYPAQPFLFRKSIKSIYIENNFIAKNSQIVLNIHHCHRDPTIWGKHADKFSPERFLEKPELIKEALLSYSTGPNNCTGQFFSKISLKVFIAALVSNFNWEITTPINWEFYFALNISDMLDIKFTKV